MIGLTPEDADALARSIQTWAVCWHFTDRNGNTRRLTTLDRDLSVSRGTVAGVDLDGIYQTVLAIQGSSVHHAADLTVDNMDVDLLLAENGIHIDDIRAGAFDNIGYTLFLVNWQSPANSGIVIKTGVVGNIKSFARDIATMELRGLTQYLQQQILDTTSLTCRYTFGDSRCGVDLAPLTLTGMVYAVESRRVFEVLLDGGSPGPSPGDFVGGVLTFTSGANAGVAREVKLDSSGSPGTLGRFEMIDAFSFDIAEDDTFSVTPGCNHLHAIADDGSVSGDCGLRFDNIVNYGGEPFVPGRNEVFAGA